MEKRSIGPLISDGFELYLGEEPIQAVKSQDLLPRLAALDNSGALELASQLEVLYHLELPDEGTTRRDLVLMADKKGNKSMVVVCRDRHVPQERHEAYKDIAVIGGLGIYDTPEDTGLLEYSLEHTKRLSVIMRRKCWMAGLELGGMKGTIPGESAWERSIPLQRATGFLFSPEGVFTDAITGTDVRQTPDTISQMDHGSTIGGDHQIAGMIEELDTPGSCRYSLEETYEAIREAYGEEIAPDWQDATMLIEGFGRIGRTAARLALERGVDIVISDPFLTREDELLPDLPDLEATKAFYSHKLAELQEEYGERIRIVKTHELADQDADVFIPCAGKEGLLDEEKIDRLSRSGVKVILSGANNIFGVENTWERASYAFEKGIIVPPEILSNCGSVTAAAMEPVLRKLMQSEDIEAHEFVEGHVIPHIATNTRQKLTMLLEIARGENVDIYTAGEIAFLRAFAQEPIIQEGILQN